MVLINSFRSHKVKIGIVFLIFFGWIVVYHIYIYSYLSSLPDHSPRTDRYMQSVSEQNIRETVAALNLVIDRYPSLAVGRNSDAGFFLNDKIPIDWSVSPEHLEKFRSWQKPWPTIAEATSIALLDQPLSEPIDDGVLARIPRSVHPHTVNYNELDVSWFDQIEGYDHWNLEKNSPLAWKTDEEYGQNVISLNFKPFFSHIEVTLLKQYILHKSSGRLNEFSKKTLKLASLLVSTENMFLTAQATRLLHKVDQWVGTGRAIALNAAGTPDVYLIARNVSNLIHPYAVDHPMADALLSFSHPLVCVGLNSGFHNVEIVKSYVGINDAYQKNMDHLFNLHNDKCQFWRLKSYWNRLKMRDETRILRFKPKYISPSFKVVDLRAELEAYFYFTLTDPLESIPK